jgi:putative Mn2+ efflux pump MntP
MYALTSMFGLGLDSFLACLAIGAHELSWQERVRLAVAFGACDAAATFVGAVRPHWLLEPPALAIYVVFVLVLGRAARSNRTLLYILPVLLSLDNLFSGAPPSTALLLGLGSAVMAMFGLSFTAACRRLILKRQEEF